MTARTRRRLARPRSSIPALLLSVVVIGALSLARHEPATAITGTQKLVVVLCKFTDKTDEPNPASFYERMFNESGAGQQGVFDYWQNVSYGQLDLTGTVVKGWYEMPKTLAEYAALDRNAKVDTCATMADPDVDFNDYAGVVVLTNRTGQSEDLFGAGPGRTINGTNYPNLGVMVSEQDQQFNLILHESAHLLRIDHSRTLSQQPSQDDYGDYYDIGSCAQCYGTNNPWGLFTTGGPGVNSVQMDTAGWIAANRKTRLDNTACRQQTVQLAALNQPTATGFLKAEIPASIFIQKIGTSTTTDLYAFEFREKSGWDAGIPADGVVVHLQGQDSYSYWVDQSGIAGSYVDAPGFRPYLRVGSKYVDSARNAFIAVNSITQATHNATVTLASCKIGATLSYVGATTGDYTESVTLAANLSVAGSGAPMPGELVTLAAGTQSCIGTTDATGRAACNVTLTDHPATTTASASFAGDTAYNGASASVPFTITREQTALTYGGASTSDYHDAFTASATLTDDGTPLSAKSIVFQLGTADSCTATTDALGVATCTIVPTQVPASYALVASFAGDIDFEPSTDSDPFVITKEQTTTEFTGPTVILQGGSGVTLKARLREDGAVAPVPAGQTLTLSLGGQSCSAIVIATGDASCSLVFTGPLGPQPLSAVFDGDAYYLPSSDRSPMATVFAFPSRGVFTIGNGAVAGAGVTWWGSQWTAANPMTAGGAPSAFKGFAPTASSLPTSSPSLSCGTTFTSAGGASTSPPSDVPAFMGVLVTSSVTKSGSTVNGSFSRIVVVRTDQGYAANPGHSGTGTVVATFCG